MAYSILPCVNDVIFRDVLHTGLKTRTKLPLPECLSVFNHAEKTSILLQWIPHEIKQTN